MARRAAVATPVTATLHPHRGTTRPPSVQPTGFNAPPPAFVQTAHNRTTWHTAAARTHKTAPKAATVTLTRKRA